VSIPKVPITRPNGKVYRPRKVMCHALSNEDTGTLTAVIVLGTHDVDAARELASRVGPYWADEDVKLGGAEVSWWRKGYCWGALCWLEDDVRGAAGVRFEVKYP